MIKGVLTGDLINSTNIAVEWRQRVVDALNACVTDFLPQSPVKIEMYRGDSFQVVVDNPELSLAVAVALRAKLRASTPAKKDIWDARISVGIGEVSFESDNIVTSDGEAFRLSGRTFDAMGKKKLTITTPWSELNNAMELVTRFADDVVSSWTVKQAIVAYHSLLFPKTQKEMAADLGLTKQNFNSHWTSARIQLILDYIEYNKLQISQFIKH
ncbi:MAG: hypothetical protein K6C30_06970 [Bacteroidaceae bacterium]|nr:hypothetical protein [Bacteroidaceae bacterium]